MRYLPFIALILAGCTGPKPICPPSPVVTITESVRISVPSEFTAGCNVECDIVTNGDLLECYARQRQALAECDARMEAIRSLK